MAYVPASKKRKVWSFSPPAAGFAGFRQGIAGIAGIATFIQPLPRMSCCFPVTMSETILLLGSQMSGWREKRSGLGMTFATICLSCSNSFQLFTTASPTILRELPIKVQKESPHFDRRWWVVSTSFNPMFGSQKLISMTTRDYCSKSLHT